MPYRLGIDVGTTFTAAAICRQAPDGTVLSELFPLGARAASVPSVLFVSPDTTLVGEAAERRALTDPDYVVRDFKRRLGDDTPIIVGDSPHHAHSLAAALVDWVVERVTSREGEPPDAIAVTYPAAWGLHRKSVLQKALGPDVLLLTEPQAAAMHYSSASRVEPGSTIAVYDLGGGTFDAAVVHKTADGSFELLGPPEGIECLGGIDFDDLVLERVLPSTGCDDAVAMARLRRECTEAKEALSSDVQTVVPVLLPDVRTQASLTRPEFESLIKPILLATVQSLSRAIAAAGLRAADVTSVLLVGGSSRIPLVTDLISAELGRPVAVDTDPKGVVALGAALAAHESMAGVDDEPDVAGLIPEPRRPDHDCDPPTLRRPRRRLRRTRVILYTLGMLILALAVIPSPFTSDSGTSSQTKKDQPTQANSPAAGGSAPQPGTTKKRSPKVQQAGATSPETEEETAAAAREPGHQPQPGSAEARADQPPATAAPDPARSSSSDPEPAGTQSSTADPPPAESTAAADTQPPPPATSDEPPPQQTEQPPPPPDPEPTSSETPPPPPEPTETS
jgi:molecular chaperone DnaK (HSP70)